MQQLIQIPQENSYLVIPSSVTLYHQKASLYMFRSISLLNGTYILHFRPKSQHTRHTNVLYISRNGPSNVQSNRWYGYYTLVIFWTLFHRMVRQGQGCLRCLQILKLLYQTFLHLWLFWSTKKFQRHVTTHRPSTKELELPIITHKHQDKGPSEALIIRWQIIYGA